VSVVSEQKTMVDKNCINAKNVAVRLRQSLTLSNTSYSMLTNSKLQHMLKAFQTRAMLVDHPSSHS
jgi:hypothetical protein